MPTKKKINCYKYGRVKNAELGAKYGSNFLTQNHDKLKTRRGVKYGLDCSRWCTHHNFVKMYDLIYDAMEESGHAKALPEAQWQNLDGVEVSKEDSARSSKVSIELTAL